MNILLPHRRFAPFHAHTGPRTVGVCLGISGLLVAMVHSGCAVHRSEPSKQPAARLFPPAAGGENPNQASWYGFKRLDFMVDGRQCILVQPAQPADGFPWLWRMEFFGHEPQADLALLARGYHVAYMDVSDMYGSPTALNHLDRFHAYLCSQYRLSPKVVLVGFSRGGLFALNWAARHPEHVASIYLDAPVCDFKSWPAGKGKSKGSLGDWDKLLRVYGLTESQALAYRFNPVDNLAPLVQAHIPILSVVGDADQIVPVEENSGVLEARYRELGGTIQVIHKPGVDHHPHSLKDPTPIVDFILSHRTD